MLEIKEEDRLHLEWYKEAKEQTLETLPSFIDKIMNSYKHDYGTICHALTSSAIAAAYACNNHPQGGITGFQAGAIMWEFIRHWNYESNKMGMKLLSYDDLLYPQNSYRFKNVINKSIFEALQKEAKLKLDELESDDFPANIVVVKHWKSIVDGVVPFNFEIKED